MLSTLPVFLTTLAVVTTSAYAASFPPSSLNTRAQGDGYTDPRTMGGQMLTIVKDTYPAGLGEPLNIIVSASSNAAVLVDSLTDGGFQNWALSVNFGAECLGQTTNSSGQQQANVGSGNTTAIATLRYNFGDDFLGTCRESKEGGNHFRYWRQNSTGAFFLAASIEQDSDHQHDVEANGYNLGRDEIASRATSNSTVNTSSLQGGETFSGSSSYNGWTYQTSVTYLTGLLSNSSDGINHYLTVEADGRPAIDGLVALLDIQVSQAGSTTSGSNGSPSSTQQSGTNAVVLGPVAPCRLFLILACAAGGWIWAMVPW